MNCVILHGCPDDENDKEYNKHWIPWVKDQLESRGIPVEVPLMPKPWHPDYEKFKNEFEKLKVEEDTILVGHSCGCAFLVRWLGESKNKISKLILVAPWKVSKNQSQFYSYLIDQTVKSRVGEIIMFTSDNEEKDGKESVELFHDALGGEIINLENHGHYTQSDMNTNSFPELLEVILD